MPPSPPPPPPHKPSPTITIGSKPVPASVSASLDDILTSSISGVLQKWVNYGRGWRRRWFVLHDGVLSYFKIHGPDKIHPQPESSSSSSSKLIGDQSLHFLSKLPAPDKPLPRPKPVGEVHLKVSTVRESRSDDKRFSIFTGTKRLHLRAETREDRAAWVEALRAVKEMYPRVSNGGEVVAPVEVVSTERLRRRLEEEGVGEEVVKECEEIVREEFAAVVRQVGMLRWKQGVLVDALRQMEV